MLRNLVVLVVLTAFGALSAAAFAQGVPRHPAKKRVPMPLLKDAMAKLDKIEARLGKAKKMNAKQLKRLKLEVKEVRLQVREFLVDVEDRKVLLPAYECCPCAVVDGTDPGGENPDGGEAVEQVEVTPMAAERFEQLLGSLADQGFADDRLAVLATAVEQNYFTVAQAIDLLKQFSFPDDKLSALKLLKPILVDYDNVYQLYGSFVHSSDKEEAKKILEAR